MLLEILIKLVFTLIDFVFKLLPDIPSLPEGITIGINSYVDLIVRYGYGLLTFVIRPSTIIITVPILIFIINFEFIFNFILFIAKKIPFLNIH